MELEMVIEIVNEAGESIAVHLSFEGERGASMLIIDGIYYHIERVRKEKLLSDYRIDDDPDYQPQADSEGYCYIFAPFSK